MPSTVAVTVIVVAPSSSLTVSSFTVSMIEVGAASSSVRLIVAEFTVRPDEVPLTVIVSLVSSTASSVGVSVKVSLPLAIPAAISMSKDDTAAKSTAVAVPLPATLTLTVLSSANRVVPSTVAVTVIVVAPSSSLTVSSSTVSVIEVGAASLSVIVPVPVPAVVETTAFVGALRDTFDSSRTSPVTDTLKVWLVVPAAKVSVPPVIAV